MRRRPRAQLGRRDASRHAAARHPSLERLESRHLMTASPGPGDELFSGHGGVCNCPVCTGVGLGDIPQAVVPAGGPAESNPLSSLPQLSSRSSATAKLFLDFNGNFQASWGVWSNVTTPVFDQDGDATTFSAGELTTIQQIWARVSEDYAPFNIDVTTIDPGSQADRVVAHIAIGGNYTDWYGSSAGGVAYVGGFYNFSSNVGYVFEAALGNGNAKYVAEAASHEAGHLFGLSHQSLYSGTTLVQTYNPGGSGWAPIMGNGYNQVRTTWHNGTTSSSTTFQDDLTILSGANNAFGYVADDYGNTTGTAAALPISGTSVSLSGLIGRSDDLDVFSFTTVGGSIDFTLAVDSLGPNLDSVLELWNSAGSVLTTVAPGASLGASLSQVVGAGTYYLVARGMGDYGDMGRYTISGTVPAAASAPEITVRIGATGITDGQTINFGSANVGSSVDRTFTVVNDGTAALNLTALNPGSLPAGFTIVSNLGSTTLAPGASTTFTLRFTPSAGGSFSGGVALANNDSNENPFDLVLQGTGVAPQPEITVRIGATGITDGQTINFGSANVGSSVDRTFTVVNDGNATLNLTALNPGSLPTGFTIVSNLGSTTLAPGASTTFTLRFTPSAGGSFSGSVALANNDSNENPFDLVLQGTGVALSPEISVSVGGSGLASGGTVNFGTTTIGTAVDRTITITNDGTGALTLTPLDPGTLPAGYSIVSNLGSTTLAAGQSTTLVLRLSAAAAGACNCTIELVNSDSNENPFALALSGTVDPPSFVPEKRIIDNGDAGSSITGAWNHITGTGYEADMHRTAKGNGTRHVRWTFTGLPSGKYNVWATWTANSKNATNAPFSFYSGNGKALVAKVNQRIAPTVSADGANWKFLKQITVNNGWAMVKLTNAANGPVVADAIRLVQVPPAAPAAAMHVHTASPGTSSKTSLYLLASSSHAEHQEPHALPLPKPSANDPAPSSRHAAHEAFWSQPSDVGPELAVLEETLSLLSEARSNTDAAEFAWGFDLVEN
jgi:hypothetical protein